MIIPFSIGTRKQVKKRLCKGTLTTNGSGYNILQHKIQILTNEAIQFTRSQISHIEMMSLIMKTINNMKDIFQL